MNRAELLARAAAAYHRAGAADAAARCYAESGSHLAAGITYQRLRHYEKAASQYILGARSDMAAWVHAHHLGQTEIARDIVADFALNRTWLRQVYEEVAHLPRLLPETWPLFPPDTDVDTLVSSTLTKVRMHPVQPSVVDRLQAWHEDRRSRFAAVIPDLLRRLILARCDVTDRVDHRDILPVLEASHAALVSSATPDPIVEEWSVTIADEIHRYDQAALIFAAAVRAGSPDAASRWREWAARVLGTELILPVSTDSR